MKGPSFCPACGAPLRLAEEPSPRPLDVAVSLDRRGTRADPAERPAAPAPRPPAAPRPPERAGTPTRRSELADLERSHWDIGALRGAEAGPPASPGARAPRGSGPETWPGRGAPAAPAQPPAAERPGRAPAEGPRAPAPPPVPARPEPRSARAAPPSALSSEVPAARAPEEEVPAAGPGPREVRVRRAEGWRRAAAWAVDGLPFAVAGTLALRWAVRAAAGDTAPGIEGLSDLAASDPAIVLSIGGAVALALAVYATLAHLLAGATFGKRLLGLRVVGPDGGRPSLGRSAARSMLSIASAGLLGLGFLLALFTASGRALHDLLARTWVVRAP